MDADVVVIGAGPAGIQAAIHASRAKVSVIIIGKLENSAIFKAEVENYFGVKGTAGKSLLNTGMAQAISFGSVHISENVASTSRSPQGFEIITESDKRIYSRSIVLAPGISRASLNVPGEKEFLGKGVSYCASCDCNFFKNKTVAVIGDESEAAISAELMTGYASKVYWIVKEPKVSDVLVSKVNAAGVKTVIGNVTKIIGDSKVSSIELDNSSVIDADGIFIELGARSSSDLAMDIDIMPNTDGTIKVDPTCMTDIKGAFACGDVTGKPWQMAKAVGEGSRAGISAAAYVKGEMS